MGSEEGGERVGEDLHFSAFLLPSVPGGDGGDGRTQDGRMLEEPR